MAYLRKNGATSNVLRFKLVNSTTGNGLTGLTGSSTGLIISTICDVEATATAYTAAGSSIQTIATLGTYAAPSANDCRFAEVDSTNHKGVYEFQFADARFAISGAKQLVITVSGATNLLQADYNVELTATDVQDGTAGGISRIDAAISSRGTSTLTQIQVTGYAGPILTDNSTGLVSSNVTQILAHAPTATTNGILDINVKNYNNQTALTGSDNLPEVSLWGILGAALTGTAANIVAAFKLFFNVGSPTLTCADVNQTGDSFARLGVPAGASIAADLAEIEAETDGIAAIPTNPLITLGANAPAAWINAAAFAASAITPTVAPNLDAAVSSRMATYTQPNGFLAANFPAGVASVANQVIIIADLGTLATTLGTPAGASVSADIAEIEAETDGIALIPTPTNNTPFSATNLENAPTGSGGGLSGPSSVTVTFVDANNVAVPLVPFTIVGQGPGQALVNGTAAFGLANGTYTVAAAPTDGTLFANASLVVSGTTTLKITGTTIIYPTPPMPGQVTMLATTEDGATNIVSGATWYFKLKQLTAGGSLVNSPPISATSVGTSAGNLSVFLAENSVYLVSPSSSMSPSQQITVGAVNFVLPNSLVY